MSNITSSQYWLEVQSIANSLATEAMQSCENDRDDAEELINDSLLHEAIDQHEWIIYNCYNLDVIQYSDNEDYLIDNFGLESAGESLKNGGLDGLHTAVAFWALYADVQEKISDELDTLEEAAVDAELED